MRSMQNRRRSGFVLSDLLLTLMIVSALIPISVFALTSLHQVFAFTPEVQDEIALQQMRRMFLTGWDFEIVNDTLTYQTVQGERTARLVNGNLILQPGTVIMLTQLDEVHFSFDGTVIVLCFRRGDQVERMVVANVG